MAPHVARHQDLWPEDRRGDGCRAGRRRQHVGFIFFPKSPRNLEPAEAGALRGSGRRQGHGGCRHGRRRRPDLGRHRRRMRPDMLQLHGRETPDRVAALKDRFGLPVIKALAVREAADLAAVGAVSRRRRPAAVRRQAAGRRQNCPAATALAFDWRLLAGLDATSTICFRAASTPPTWRSAAAGKTRPPIDVSSGVERAPGVKDVRR